MVRCFEVGAETSERGMFGIAFFVVPVAYFAGQRYADRVIAPWLLTYALEYWRGVKKAFPSRFS